MGYCVPLSLATLPVYLRSVQIRRSNATQRPSNSGDCTLAPPRTIEFRDRFRVEFRDSLFLQVQNEMYALGIGLGLVFCVNFDTQNAT